MSQQPDLENGEMNRQINPAYQVKITHLILFPLTQNQNWPRLQKEKLRTLTLLQEVLDYEKTPALISTASLFIVGKSASG